MSSIRANKGSSNKSAKRKRSNKTAYTSLGNALDADFVDTSDDDMIEDFADEDRTLYRTAPLDEDNEYSTSYGIDPHHDLSNLILKADADKRPLWVLPDGHIFLETYSPIYRHATDFLIAIADPVTRPLYIHEYKVTPYSLYAAASLGLTTDDILDGLNRLSKVELDSALDSMIRETTERCGKVRMLLNKQHYYVESQDPAILDMLLDHEEIYNARVDIKRRIEVEQQRKREALKANNDEDEDVTVIDTSLADKDGMIPNQQLNSAITDKMVSFELDPATGYLVSQIDEEDTHVVLPGTGPNKKKVNVRATMGIDVTVDDTDLTPKRLYSFEIEAPLVEEVRRLCSQELNYPLLEEYDFRNDDTTADLPMSLKASTLIREYQEKALSKMFGNGRARSGIIVLPCGAGKTLVGITAAATVRKSCLVFATTGVSVNQWRNQFLHWSTLDDRHIVQFTASNKDPVRVREGEALVVITTYNMVAFNGKRSAAAEQMMKLITSQEWGLILLDEVHVAPARMFRRCMSMTHSRTKLGLTATLVREDDLIEDLFFLIGPKLYEANWLDLSQKGHLASVQCVEVWCPMTSEFYSQYLSSSPRKQQLLWVMNPNKFRACEYLIRLHEARGDKVLVFADNVFALRHYAIALNKPMIYGATSDAERLQFLYRFQHDATINCLFISKVGDTSLDLPDVNVIIQISSHFASRRQEAQRLGRILRPKSSSVGQYNAFFYSLVSRDTREMMYATKRQRFLVDQGYAFQVLTDLPDLNKMTDLKYSKPEDQRKLLYQVMAASEEAAIEEDEIDTADPFAAIRQKARKRALEGQSKGNISALSGGSDKAYAEVKAGDTRRNLLFRKRDDAKKGR